MSQQTTIRKLAELVNKPVDKLLEQLAEAGMSFSGPDQVVTSAEKLKLLGFLKRSHGKAEASAEETAAPKKITLNAELIAPFPGAGNDRTLRWFAFVDAGNVYGENDNWELSELRASAGLGLSWISPLGPLRLAYAQPVRKFAGDRIQKLQFQIGTSF